MKDRHFENEVCQKGMQKKICIFGEYDFGIPAIDVSIPLPSSKLAEWMGHVQFILLFQFTMPTKAVYVVGMNLHV